MRSKASYLPAAKSFRRKKSVHRRKFKNVRRRKPATYQRRCSFCRTQHLTDGTIVFIGVTACPLCLRDESTADFRELLVMAQDAYHRNFRRLQ